MDFESQSRKELQALAKEHGIKANLKTSELVELLSEALAPDDAAGEHQVVALTPAVEESMAELEEAAEADVEVAEEAAEADVEDAEETAAPPTPPPAKAPVKPAQVTWSVWGKRLPPGPVGKAPVEKPPAPPQSATAPPPPPPDATPDVQLPPRPATAPKPTAAPAAPNDAPAAAPVECKSRPATAGGKRPMWQQTPFVPLKSGRKPTTHDSVPYINI